MAYVSQEMKKSLAPNIKKICKEYGITATLSVRHHSTLCLNISKGKLDFGKDEGTINPYIIERHYEDKPKVRDFMLKVKDAMLGPDYFDHSDIQSDYFHCSHYVEINVGKWDKPYIFEK